MATTDDDSGSTNHLPTNHDHKEMEFYEECLRLGGIVLDSPFDLDGKEVDPDFNEECLRLNGILLDEDRLTKLPTEILIMIVEELRHDQKALARLSRTCSAIKAVSEPILYKMHVTSTRLRAGDELAPRQEWNLPRAILHGAWHNLPRTIKICVDHIRKYCNLADFNIDAFLEPEQDVGEGAALAIAAFRGNDEAVKVLLALGADLELSGLLECHCSRHEELCIHFIEPHGPFDEFWLPLHYALCQGHTSTAEILMARGAKYLMSDYPDVTINAFHTAAGADHDVRIFHTILKKVRNKDEPNWGEDDYDSMQQLVNHASNVGTPLHFATIGSLAKGLLPMERMLTLGADIDASNYLGPTPIFLAVESGLWEAAKLLLRRGADISPRHRSHEPLIVNAIWSSKHYHHIKRGSFAWAYFRNGEYPTHDEIEEWKRGRREFIEELIDSRKIDINTQYTSKGRTPLTWIAEKACDSRDHLPIMKHLRSYGGADLARPDPAGSTALHRLCAAFVEAAYYRRQTRINIVQSIHWIVKNEGHHSLAMRDSKGQTPVAIILAGCSTHTFDDKTLESLTLLGFFLAHVAWLDRRDVIAIGEAMSRIPPQSWKPNPAGSW